MCENPRYRITFIFFVEWLIDRYIYDKHVSISTVRLQGDEENMKTAQERADEYAMNEATRQETNALDAQDRACQAFYDSLDW